MKVLRVDRRLMLLGDPEEGEMQQRIVALRCVCGDPDRREPVVIWMPLQCPVAPGDHLWTQGYYAMWTPTNRRVEDVGYIQADRGWNFDGTPVYERRKLAEVGRA